MKSARKLLFWMHLAAGTIAGAVIFTMSVTGVLLAYERQVLAWADSAASSAHRPTGAQRLSMDELLGKIRASEGDGLSAVTLRSDPERSVEASLGRDRISYFDPYTGVKNGEGSSRARAFFGGVENMHRWLAMEGPLRNAGRAVTGAANLLFLALVLSGPLLWLRNRRSRAALWFRSGLRGKAREFNWHHVVGIWTAAPLAVIVVSGSVMSYPWANNLLYRLTGSPAPANGGTAPANGGTAREQDGHHGRRRADVSGGVSWEAMFAAAAERAPGWHSIRARIAAGGSPVVEFQIDRGDGGRPDLRSQLTLDRRTGAALKWEPFESYNAGRRLRGWLRFAHTGEAGGVAGETVAALATGGAAALAWSGIALAVRRFLAWRARRVRAVVEA